MTPGAENNTRSLVSLKNCLEILNYSIKKIKIRKNILEDEKYKYIYSVENLNELVNNGYSFRDAYLKISDDIKNDNYGYTMNTGCNRVKGLRHIFHKGTPNISSSCSEQSNIPSEKNNLFTDVAGI